MDQYIVDDNIVYKFESNTLFRGWAAVKPPVLRMKPQVFYHGPTIKLEDWRQILAFFIWSNEDCKSETQVRFYLNEKEGLWRPWAFPQEHNTGMRAIEIDERCDSEREKAGLDGRWVVGGTAHHHCNGPAWQSGTDKENENSQHGIHITVGNLDKMELSIDGRVYYKGIKYEPHWPHWFEMPPGLEGLAELPWNFEQDIMKHVLTQRPDKNQEFPKEWRDNVIRKARVVYDGPKAISPGPMGWYGGHGHSDGHGHWHGSDEMTEAGADANAGKPKSKLSRKDRKRFQKALGWKTVQGYSAEDLAILEQAAKRINLLVASLGASTTLRDLIRWTTVHPGMLGTEQNEAVDKLDEILNETGADLGALSDWIDMMAEKESSA